MAATNSWAKQPRPSRKGLTQRRSREPASGTRKCSLPGLNSAFPAPRALIQTFSVRVQPVAATLFPMHPVNKKLCTFMIWCALQGRAHAKTNVEFVLNYLEQRSSNGNQVADETANEDMLLFEPTLFIDSKITPNTNINAVVVYDSYSTASAQILYSETAASGAGLVASPADTDFFDANPLDGELDTESGKEKKKPKLGKNWENRTGVSAGVSQRFGTWIFSPRIGYSDAVPYRSKSAGLSVDKTFKEETYTLSAGYSAFRDQTYDFSYELGRFTEWQKRNTDTMQISFAAVLSPVDVSLIGLSLTNQTGALRTNMNSVNVGGGRKNEVLPEERSRDAITLRHAHAFNASLAAHLDYRYYYDGWGIRAHSVEPSLVRSFADDDGLLRFSYRFHTQTAAKYYQDSFDSNLSLMTSDSDLSKLNTHEIATQCSYTLDSPISAFDTIRIGGGSAYYKRSNGLQIVSIQGSLGVTF
ncbi:MAG: DUF3570 domain-containing protein [Proteobacteria bacterium]|nr:DUF3570 domain-containing protein [Pseudomonadota bacterium]